MLIAIRSGVTDIPLESFLPHPLPSPRHIQGMVIEAGFGIAEAFEGNAVLHVDLLGHRETGGPEVSIGRRGPIEAEDLAPGLVVTLRGVMALPLNLTRAPFLRLWLPRLREFSAGTIKPFAFLRPYGYSDGAGSPELPPNPHPSKARRSGFAIR